MKIEIESQANTISNENYNYFNKMYLLYHKESNTWIHNPYFFLFTRDLRESVLEGLSNKIFHKFPRLQEL